MYKVFFGKFGFKSVLNFTYNAHDALEDCKILQQLTELPVRGIQVHFLNTHFNIYF